VKPNFSDIIAAMSLSFNEALKLIKLPDEKSLLLLAKANELRQKYKGNKISLCAIVNAKSGKCSENCSFCAQSAHHAAKASCPTYQLISADETVRTAKKARQNQANCFSIVTSGKGTKSEAELEEICKALKEIKKTGMRRCVSLGILSREQLKRLKKAGLTRLHHNLESAESFFNKICTTHTFSERLQTIKDAKAVGLEVCAGGIFGLGETIRQRIELAFALKELEVESVPINILHPIAGTPAANNHKPMTPWEVLRLIAVFRLIMPKADIGLFGGREYALGSLQPLLFLAGANVILTGDYLVTKGQENNKDIEMIKALGLKPELEH
jgi:biotin synthase